MNICRKSSHSAYSQEALVSKVPLVVLDDEEDLEVDPRGYAIYESAGGYKLGTAPIQ